MADSPQQTAFSSAESGFRRHKLKMCSLDRISSLPDSVLFYILSFLPTITVVATSILSKRWKRLWRRVPSFHFEYFLPLCTATQPAVEVRMRYGLSEFAEFVNNFLILNCAPINKFKLSCGSIVDSAHFSSWVSAAIARRVQEMELYFPTITTPVKLPYSLLHCRTLVVLKLSRRIVLYVPASAYLPSLKTLFLDEVKDQGNDSLQKFLIGCPILETLVIKRDCWHRNDRILNISAHSLKNLTIYCILPHKFEINAPSLEYLSLTSTHGDYVHSAFTIEEDLSSLVEAKFAFRNVNSALEVLRGIHNVKFLSLSGFILEPHKYTSHYDLPLFHNLTQLEIDISCSFLSLLSNLLESSSNLEILTIRLNKDFACHEGHVCSRQLGHVPKCFSLQLTTIDISGFEGLKFEMKLVRYVLKNAKVLKMMTIRSQFLSLEGEFRVRNKLSRLPRGSKTCQVAFF